MSLLKKIQDKYGVIHEIGDNRVDAFETELTGAEHNVPYSPAVLKKTNAIEQKIDDHTKNLSNPHEVTKEQIGLANVENKSSTQIRSEITKENVTNALGYTPIDESKIGAVNGVASLDSGGKIPASQIPGGFDNIEEYDTLKSFPTTGEEGKIYVTKDTNLTYRWTGTKYVEISPSIALGETSKTAYRGDRGKIAYEHSQITGNTSIHHTHANKELLDSYTQTEADLANAVAKVHEHGNKTVLDGITSDKVASWDGKEDALTAGDNVTIANNVISSNQVFVATYGTTTYQEIKDAYDAGKICLCTRPEENYKVFYLRFVTKSEISFTTGIIRGNSYNLATVDNKNTWVHDFRTLQSRLTFDTTPTAGSSNPVTSDGIKSAIVDSVDQTYSPTSTKAQSGVAVNEAFKTRETSGSGDSYTYLGMKKTQNGTEELYWKLVSFKTVNNYWTLQFEVDVSNGRKGEAAYDTEIYETKRLTICGASAGVVTYANELRYAAQGIDSNRGYGNNIYYEISNSNFVTVYIKAIDKPNKTQICRLTDVRNFQGISNITWHEVTADAGTQPTNPVKFKEVFPAIASTSSNVGSESVPVYVNKGKPVSCNSSNLKAGKDDDGNVIKNTYAKKTELSTHTGDTTVHITAAERKAWNEKQSALTFDTTPTAGSNNPVTSNGIKTAIDTINAKGITVKEISGEQVICFE